MEHKFAIGNTVKIKSKASKFKGYAGEIVEYCHGRYDDICRVRLSDRKIFNYFEESLEKVDSMEKNLYNFRREEVENYIFELAEIIRENRTLRRENSDLRLRLTASDALIGSFAGHDNGEYEFLSEIIRKNSAIDLCRASGWETSEERTSDWEVELKKFRARKEEGDESLSAGHGL